MAELPSIVHSMQQIVRGAERFASVLREADVRDMQEHPDIAEMDLQLNGFYDHPTTEHRGAPR